MQLPLDLQHAIDREVESKGLLTLIEARETLTDRYRGPRQKGPHITQDSERLSYLLTRMPATYAANFKVWQAIKERAPDLAIGSLLDLGAGPGTAMWAACELFPSIKKITLIEQDSSLANFGQRLIHNSNIDSHGIKEAKWIIDNLETIDSFPSHDVVILSYSIGELPPEFISKLIEKSWAAANQMLMIIEPGTPVGFERIRKIRSQLIEMKGNLIAPCPNHLPCPMSGRDWCHFAARVERTSLHRRLKGGTLGYEDEKFSYVAATKQPYPLPHARVLREPQRRSGHVILTLCTEGIVKQETLSKRHPEAYRIARKLDWGDALNIKTS
jgi:ribosomal protein RSM22 (predicted rRNA methylase)